MNCIYGKLAAIQISVIQPLWFLCRPVYSISYEMKIELGGKMLYLFKYSSIWLFKQSGKGTGKAQSIWLKLNPEDTHTEKQVKKQNIKFARKDTKIHEHDIWRARDIPDFLLWLSAVTTDEDGGGRWRCAGANGGTEPGRDRKTIGTPEEACLFQKMNIFGRNYFFSARILKSVHLSGTFEFIWQKWLNVPGTLWVGITLPPLTSCVSSGKKFV